VKILEELRKQNVSTYKRDNKRTEISKSREQQYIQINEAEIFRKVCLKYTILKIRHKISYMAFIQKKTIPQLLFQGILNTYQKLQTNKVIEINEAKESLEEFVIKALKINDLGILKSIMANNL
jgi:hypothetical protein